MKTSSEEIFSLKTDKNIKKTSRERLPSWLRRAPGRPSKLHSVKTTLREGGLSTVCESARCPNIGECFSKPTATFMILGDICTRRCGFCNVKKTSAESGHNLHGINQEEPGEVAKAAKKMKLSHVVVTSVTRDDLPDGGASHFAETIKEIRKALPKASVEVLVPDFGADKASVDTVIDARPDIFNHNIETVKRLYPQVRPVADYANSLEILKQATERGLITKSGIMVGFGESAGEVGETLQDLKNAGCSAVTIGQYLQPKNSSLPVFEYIRPEVFKEYEAVGLEIGLKHVFAGSFVRSSYNALELFQELSGGALKV
ncbi:MAG: lipoyl synthase [Deltaproteobacteria bacterium]|nr:lipoyl synthase [Deltaproteobacteria bacterium]